MRWVALLTAASYLGRRARWVGCTFLRKVAARVLPERICMLGGASR